MRKMYIIMANDIHVIGGAELYIYGKCKYLESEGWKVKILFSGKNSGNCKIEYLNKYLGGGIDDLSYVPYHLHECHRKWIIQQMVEYVQADNIDEIIIESQYDVSSFWGELLAEQINGKHYIFCIGEDYRSVYYQSNLDYFKFKFDRNELLASQKAITLLFDGYKGITKTVIDYPMLAMEADPVQDVYTDKLELIPEAKYNICSIGRTDKPYMPYAIQGIKELAIAHPEESINFIVIGDEKHINLAEFEEYKNLNVVCLGIMFPIPRCLFSKIDVVIAAAQAAQFAAYEDVFVIVANVLTDSTPGVLGCDTLDYWYGGKCNNKSYKEVLEDIFIFNKYDKENVKMPERKPAEYYYNLQWKYLSLSSKKREYYTMPFESYRRSEWVNIFPYWAVCKNSKVLIYGAGKVGRDYYRQIETTCYCSISGILDTDENKCSNKIFSPEVGLQTLDYDVVVIAVESRTVADEIKKDIEKYTNGKPIIHDIKSILVE